MKCLQRCKNLHPFSKPVKIVDGRGSVIVKHYCFFSYVFVYIACRNHTSRVFSKCEVFPYTPCSGETNTISCLSLEPEYAKQYSLGWLSMTTAMEVRLRTCSTFQCCKKSVMNAEKVSLKIYTQTTCR